LQKLSPRFSGGFFRICLFLRRFNFGFQASRWFVLGFFRSGFACKESFWSALAFARNLGFYVRESRWQRWAGNYSGCLFAIVSLFVTVLSSMVLVGFCKSPNKFCLG
jgi:hypothetical protein